MVPTPRYAGERVVVMGLGKSGLSAAASLRASGAKVQVWDDQPAQVQEGTARGFSAFDGAQMNLEGVRTVVWSPGIPHTLPKVHPLAARARAAGVALTCDVDLLVEAQTDATVIGITGTNGKSTTTALAAHVFKHAGRKAAVGGNIGIPALELEPLGLGGTYILELSSYQLELMPHLHCETAVLLNITPDHLDRHGGLEGYVAAKRRIFAYQRAPRTAIIGVDDMHCAALADALSRDGLHNVVRISVRAPVTGGFHVQDGVLFDTTGARPRTICDLKTMARLPGAHNWQNAAAVAAIACTHGMSHEQLVAGFKTFPGLKHRQELVGVVDNVTFINDSKATNADAAEKALLCYDNIYWIAGGVAKEGGIAPLAPLFPRIRHAFLIGQAADSFADTLEGKVPFALYEDMESAIEEAGAMALKEKRPGATVLLSPACASFDMFKSFEHRGDRFREEVRALWPQAVSQ
ncbi:MAG: UDP-N-acetylmuramoyl-L-alanine--D-glutamate ligase [Rhodospirillaceae bacterium]